MAWIGWHGVRVGASDAGAPEQVTLQLKWHHQFQFAGYYAAEAKGFYAEEGLAVRIVEGGPTRSPLPTVLSGGADFGVSDSDIVLARMKGQPVVACAAIFQHSPYVIMSLKERGIHSPADLPGKRVMLAEDQGSAQFRGMMVREGVAPELVKVVKHSWDLSDLIEGRVDAMSAYAMVEPVRLKARGIETSLLRAVDYGVDFYGDTLFTTEAQVRAHPKRVAAFVHASLRGWDYAMKHPEEIADLIVQMEGVAQRGDTREIILEHARGMHDFILSDVVEIGHMNPGRWEHIARTFAGAGMAPREFSLAGFIHQPKPLSDPVVIRRIMALGAASFVVAGLALLWNVQVRRLVRQRTRELQAEVSQRKQAEEELRRSEEHFRMMVEQAGEGIFICEVDGRCIGANKAGCEMFGFTESEILQVRFMDVVAKEELSRIGPEMAHVLAGGVLQTQWKVCRKDGSEFACEVNSKLRSDGRLQIYARDVSKREAAARRQQILQRTVRTVSEANSLIVRATSEGQLLKDFCERMVTQTGHRLVWIGFLDETTNQVRVVAKAGEALDYLDGIQITCDDSPTGRGPTGISIRTGQTVSCRSFASDPNVRPWLERAERAQLRSSVSAPLRVDGRVIGAFTLYSDTEGRFDEDESQLLTELADDLSFAIGALRRERWMRIINHAVEHSPASVVITNVDGNIEYVNAKFTELTGYTAQEALGLNPRILKSGDISEETYRDLWKTITSGREWRGEFHNRKKNGNLYWELASISPLPDEHGRITRYIAIKEDITARKEAEERLRGQLARTDLLNQIVRAIGERTDLETILSIVACNLEDHLPVDFSALCLADEDRDVVAVTALGSRSEALTMDTSLAKGERIAVVPQGIAPCLRGVLVHEPELADAKAPFASALRQVGMSAAVFVPLAMKEQVFGVLVAAQREPNSFSSPDCEFLRQLGEQVALAIYQVRLNADLKSANDELRETYATAVQQERLRALGQMASGVAHDINNAISPVAIYCDLLQQTEPNLSAESKDFLKTIQHSIQDVAGTVSRLREFYRKREEQTELFPVALTYVAKEVVKLTRARWVDMPQERGIVIDMDLQLATGLPEVPGVESEIREALINLVFNAVDAMPGGGKLTLRTGLTEQELPSVFVEVADSGTGMNEETRRRCLEPFFTTKGERGTGLGLAMVCGVAQRHEAEITIESELGKGTTIRLNFPLSEKALAHRRPAPARDAVPPMKVLVIDDDPLITRALELGLATNGHSVISADGGQTGLDRFHEALAKGQPFQMVITDLGMPHVDGRQVAAAVKATNPQTPVVLLTGWGQQLIDANTVPENVDRVLSKPPRLKEVCEVLGELGRAARD